MRPANAIVKLTDTSANGVALAIKLLRRKLDRSSLTALVFRQESQLYAYQSPGKRRAAKSARHRARLRRRDLRRAQYDDFHDRGGDRAAHPNSAPHSRGTGASAGEARLTSPASSSASASAQRQVSAA